MKITQRVNGVFFLIALYCFAIGVFTVSFAGTGLRAHAVSDQEVILSDISSALFCHTAQSESLIGSVNNPPVNLLKKSFLSYCTVIKATEQLNETAITQNSIFKGSVLLNHRKSDLIFPFHYYW